MPLHAVVRQHSVEERLDVLEQTMKELMDQMQSMMVALEQHQKESDRFTAKVETEMMPLVHQHSHAVEEWSVTTRLGEMFLGLLFLVLICMLLAYVFRWLRPSLARFARAFRLALQQQTTAVDRERSA